jgi:hypothetical protein
MVQHVGDTRSGVQQCVWLGARHVCTTCVLRDTHTRLVSGGWPLHPGVAGQRLTLVALTSHGCMCIMHWACMWRQVGE